MQRLEVHLEDDLTGGPAEETVGFGVDGRAYEIDLNAKHAADFRRQLARFIEHARLARAGRGHATARTIASRERSRHIRLWAQAQGLDIAEHGRLPGQIIAQYERQAGERQASENRRAARHRASADKPAAARPRDRDRPRRRRAGHPG